jgi:hypothetical protein
MLYLNDETFFLLYETEQIWSAKRKNQQIRSRICGYFQGSKHVARAASRVARLWEGLRSHERSRQR